MPGDNFYRYEATVSENPIITKALTSCVAYGLGDLTAQIFLVSPVEVVDIIPSAMLPGGDMPFVFIWYH